MEPKSQRLGRSRMLLGGFLVGIWAATASGQPAPNMVTSASEQATTSSRSDAVTSAMLESTVATGASATTGSDEMTRAASSGRTTVVLRQSPPDRKVEVIKIVRQFTGLGLKEAKELVESVPASVATDLPPADAAKLKTALEQAGAVVEVK